MTVPALTSENNMLAASMSHSVNGVDYVATKRILSGSAGWKNNALLNAGFYPGSGLQNGLQVRGRMEMGARVPSFREAIELCLEVEGAPAQTLEFIGIQRITMAA